MGISGSQDNITLDFGVNNLTGDVSVGDTDDETVLRSVVLVFVLNNKTFTSIVIGLSFTATTILNLETFIVSTILLNFLKCLQIQLKYKVKFKGTFCLTK